MTGPFHLYLRYVHREHILSDRCFALLAEGTPEDQRQHCEMLRYEATQRHQIPAEQVESWLRETGRRYREDPERFRAKALSNQASEPQSRLATISATDLQRKEIPPIRWVVEGLIAAGLTLLCSPPKFGKSWLSLDLCLKVSAGGRFLGYPANRCGCLYLALEDGERRLKSRLDKLLNGQAAPEGFHFATSAPTLHEGLLDVLEDFRTQHPDTGLVIVDTLQKVREMGGGRDVYGRDYADAGALKAYADEHGLALVLVHHLRKMGDDDPFMRIAGSNGLLGAADTALVLAREKRGDANTRLSVTGRDVEQAELMLTFDKETCTWRNLGDADAFSGRQARLPYQTDPLVQTVKQLVSQSPDGWTGTSKQLMEAGRFIAGRSVANSLKAVTSKLKKLAPLLLEYDNILYQRKGNGSGGGKHIFTRADQQAEADTLEEVEELPTLEELEASGFDPFSLL